MRTLLCLSLPPKVRDTRTILGFLNPDHCLVDEVVAVVVVDLAVYFPLGAVVVVLMVVVSRAVSRLV